MVAADFTPVVPGVIGTHDVPVLLHEQHAGSRRVHGDAVNTVADFGGGLGDVLRNQAAVDRLPGGAGVVATESARCRDRDVDALGIGGIEHDGVQAHSASAGLPA